MKAHLLSTSLFVAVLVSGCFASPPSPEPWNDTTLDPSLEWHEDAPVGNVVLGRFTVHEANTSVHFYSSMFADWRDTPVFWQYDLLILDMNGAFLGDLTGSDGADTLCTPAPCTGNYDDRVESSFHRSYQPGTYLWLTSAPGAKITDVYVNLFANENITAEQPILLNSTLSSAPLKGKTTVTMNRDFPHRTFAYYRISGPADLPTKIQFTFPDSSTLAFTRSSGEAGIEWTETGSECPTPPVLIPAPHEYDVTYTFEKPVRLESYVIQSQIEIPNGAISIFKTVGEMEAGSETAHPESGCRNLFEKHAL